MSNFIVRKAAVLGAGVMGAQIAAHLANAEVPVVLFDLPPKEGDPNGNPWGISFMQGLFNMTSDPHLFHTREELEDDGWTLNGNVFERPLDGGVSLCLLSSSGD